MSTIGLNWLKWLISQPDLIQHGLDEGLEEHEESLLRDIRAYFAPFSRIPLHRITFLRKWNEHRLNVTSRSILFSQRPITDEPDHKTQERKGHELLQKLVTLTGVLADHDPQAPLQLFVLNWEGYYDMLEQVNGESVRELFLELDPKEAQILWIHAGKGFRIVPDHLTNLSLFEQNTLDLLRVPNESR